MPEFICDEVEQEIEVEDFLCFKPRGSDIDIDQDAAREKAQADGFEVVESGPYILLLDLDDIESHQTYLAMLPIIQNHLHILEEETWRSKSGGWHVKLASADPLPTQERLLLQTCLGPDLKKEFLGMMRARAGMENPSMLFRPKKTLTK